MGLCCCCSDIIQVIGRCGHKEIQPNCQYCDVLLELHRHREWNMWKRNIVRGFLIDPLSEDLSVRKYSDSYQSTVFKFSNFIESQAICDLLQMVDIYIYNHRVIRCDVIYDQVRMIWCDDS